MKKGVHDVIICTRNRPEGILEIIESLSESSTKETLHIIVVENSENTEPKLKVKEILSRFNNFASITLINSDPGLTRARNQGIAIADSEYVTFFDDDVVVPETYFSTLKRLFEENPDVAGFTPIINVPRTLEMKSKINKILQKLAESRVMSSFFIIKGLLPNNKTMDIEVGWMPGCAMSFRNSIIKGRCFNTDLENGPTGGYALGEDFDFTHRIYRDGYLLKQGAKLTVTHNLSPINREKIENMERAIGRWLAYRSKKFSNPVNFLLDIITFTIIEFLKVFTVGSKAEFLEFLKFIRLRNFYSELFTPTL